MGGLTRAVLLHALILTGGLALALSTGLAVIHWVNGRRPYLDAFGWALATYGATALATWDVLAGEANAFTTLWIATAVASGYFTGRRTCAQWVVVIPDQPEEGPT